MHERKKNPTYHVLELNATVIITIVILKELNGKLFSVLNVNLKALIS